MSALVDRCLPRGFWKHVARASHRLLMLDYDGTLSPLRANRHEARPGAGNIERLRRIGSEARTTLAIVSGRPVSELLDLLGPLPATLVGEHGWELYPPDGPLARHPLGPVQSEALEWAHAGAVRAGLERRIERKRTSLMLHTRGLPADEARGAELVCEDAWRRIAAQADMKVKKVDGGLELRSPARDKGSAVRDLLAAVSKEALCVYIGDDETDEDAFAALPPTGFAIGVGDPGRLSLAAARLATIADVSEFLDRWAVEAASGFPRRRQGT